MVLLIVAVALTGLAIGSFLNVVIYRIPAHESLSRPPSRCPSCGHRVRARHNIPVLGWLVLRGKCADCGTRISIRYPLTELVTMLLFVAIAVQLNHLDVLPALPAYLCFAAVGIALTCIDLDVRLLPDSIVLPTYPVLAVLLSIAAIAQHDPAALIRAVIGAAALFGFYYALTFAYPAGMGYGDVKLAGIVGGVLGFLSYQALLIGAFGAFLIGSAGGLFVILKQQGSRKSAIPFGPFMVAGALLAFFASTPIAGMYSRLVLGA